MARGPTSQVGDRIAIARRRRGISRRALANIIGRSEEWLRQIENGHRRLDSIEYAVRLGQALRIGNIWAFLGMEVDAGSPSSDIKSIAHIREALLDSVAVQAFTPQPAWHHAAATIEADVAEARRRWLGRGDRYHQTLTLLPRLLHGAANRLHANGDSAVGPAIVAYHLARTVLSRLGEGHLALLAADRAMAASGRVGGAALLAASWHVSACYLEQGSLVEAYRFALGADGQQPAEDLPDGPLLSGALCLVAADAAAAMLEAHRAHDLLGKAKRIAATVGDVIDPYFVPFGPTEVGIRSVQMAVRLGHPGDAIRLAAQIEIPEDYPADRQARHYIPLAHLHSRRNEDAAAVLALTKVATMSPEDIRYDHLSRDTLYRLLRRNNFTVRRELDGLAHIAGIG